MELCTKPEENAAAAADDDDDDDHDDHDDHDDDDDDVNADDDSDDDAPDDDDDDDDDDDILPNHRRTRTHGRARMHHNVTGRSAASPLKLAFCVESRCGGGSIIKSNRI